MKFLVYFAFLYAMICSVLSRKKEKNNLHLRSTKNAGKKNRGFFKKLFAKKGNENKE